MSECKDEASRGSDGIYTRSSRGGIMNSSSSSSLGDEKLTDSSDSSSGAVSCRVLPYDEAVKLYGSGRYQIFLIGNYDDLTFGQT